MAKTLKIPSKYIQLFWPFLWLVVFIFSTFVIYNLAKYTSFWYNIHGAKLYINHSYTAAPVLEEDLDTVTWIIHKYVPAHNAGSEWMAHAMNKYLIQNEGYRVNVIVNTSPVSEFERVHISQREYTERNEKFIRHSSLILSHHNQEPNAIRTAALAERPIVLLMHDDGRKPYLQEYVRLASRKNIHLIHNSYWLKEYYSIFGFNSIVVHPPVDWREYVTETSREYVVLINCNRNKGGDLLIEIAKEMPDVQFLGVKGAYNKQIVDPRIPNITYIPQTSYIKEIYSKTDILLMPSIEESWGRTAIEAMSSGIPVIANPTPGLLESCGDAGIFCKRVVGEWVKEIRRLKTDTEYYNSVSSKCKARAKELEPEKQLKSMSQWLKTLKWV
jgi:glycosyltransferase involved in cell wall biosynthesis